MSQIIEYTKHSSRYLIHHFSFVGNDDMRIGQFAGNYSMNKFMSPLEWHMIFNHLSELIEKYLKNSKAKRPNVSIDLTDTNIELNVEWSEMDAVFYSKIFPTLDIEMIYPFVMLIKVGYKSNMMKFVPPAGKELSQIAKNVGSQKNTFNVDKTNTLTTADTAKSNASTPKTPVASTSKTKTPTPKSSKKSVSLISVSTSMAVDATLSKTIGSNASVDANGIRPLTIPLDRLTSEEIDRLTGATNLISLTIPTGGGKKRKHQSLNDSASTPQKEMPSKRAAPDTPFVDSVNSTPYVRLSKTMPDTIDTDVSHISAENHKSKKTKAGPMSSKTKKVDFTKTPLSSKRNAAKNAKPRLQVSIGHLTAKPKKLSKVKKNTLKVKKSKKGSKSDELIDDESSSIEIIETNASDQSQQPSTSRAGNDKENYQPKKKQSNGSTYTIDLKNLTESDVVAGFQRNSGLLKSLFKRNVRQNEFKRATDYAPMEIIRLLTHEQFSNMLDILYDHFKGYSNEECETLFFDIIIPEWTLAMFMRKTSLERDAAIKLINSQSMDNHDQSTFRDE